MLLFHVWVVVLAKREATVCRCFLGDPLEAEPAWEPPATLPGPLLPPVVPLVTTDKLWVDPPVAEAMGAGETLKEGGWDEPVMLTAVPIRLYSWRFFSRSKRSCRISCLSLWFSRVRSPHFPSLEHNSAFMLALTTKMKQNKISKKRAVLA